jgi:hypothetical protein
MVDITSDVLKRESVFFCQGTVNMQFYRSQLLRIINNSSFDVCSTTGVNRRMILVVNLQN